MSRADSVPMLVELAPSAALAAAASLVMAEVFAPSAPAALPASELRASTRLVFTVVSRADSVPMLVALACSADRAAVVSVEMAVALIVAAAPTTFRAATTFAAFDVVYGVPFVDKV